MELNLHGKQSVAFESTATEILYGGSAGGGKSYLMRAKSIALASQIPGLQIYLFRRESEDIQENHFEGPDSYPEMLHGWIESGYCRIVYSPKCRIRFANGATIHASHLQHVKHLRKYQGRQIHVLLIDELTHFTDTMYRYLRSRCRIPKKNKKVLEGIAEYERKTGLKANLPLVLCGTNPGGIGHNWVKASFIDPQVPYEIKKQASDDGGMMRQFIPAVLEDNPSLDKDEYAEKLAGLGNPYLVKAMLEGSWDIVAGGMFDDVWNPAVHVLEPFPIPKSWRIDRSFDWGSSKPFSVGWWAESDGCDVKLKDGTYRTTKNGDLFRIAELYGWNGKPNEGCKMLSKDIAKRIKKIEKKFPFKVKPGPADSSIWKEEDGPSTASNMADVGIKWEKANKAPGTRSMGWELLRGRFQGAKTGEEPGLFVFNSCRNFIRTIPVLPRDDVKSDDIDTDAEDHIADETRYRILTRSKVTMSGTTEGMGG